MILQSDPGNVRLGGSSLYVVEQYWPLYWDYLLLTYLLNIYFSCDAFCLVSVE